MSKILSKIRKLEKELNYKSLFVFPSYKGVCGFDGVGDVMFVCQKASTSNFPTAKDKIFYKTLAKNGFANAHITDLVKTVGGSKGKISKKERETGWAILKDEIRILHPRLIVAVGNNSFDNLVELQKTKSSLKNIGIVKITHYSYRYGKKPIEKRLMEDMANIKSIYNCFK